MKIVFLGDSITDMGRDRVNVNSAFATGVGYPHIIKSKLSEINPLNHEIINRGNSGDRIVDLYARIKQDVWEMKPDVLSILVGINDIWHEIDNKNGVDLIRFEKVYRMLIDDTFERLPKVKIILMEPFVLKGEATEEKFDDFMNIENYAKVIENIANDYNISFVKLQDKFNEMNSIYGNKVFLYDGIHPHVAGATLIANEWLKVFNRISN